MAGGSAVDGVSGARRRVRWGVFAAAGLVASTLAWAGPVQEVSAAPALATVTVTKSVLPANTATWSAQFHISPAPFSGANPQVATQAGASVSWTVVPGVYTVFEDLPLAPGWTAGSLNCVGDTLQTGPSRGAHAAPRGTGPTPPSDQIFVASGDDVQCTITNAGPPTLTVTKTVFPKDLPDWKTSFVISPDPDGPAGQEANHQVTKANPSWTWILTPGVVYTVTEIVDGGWTAGAINCHSTRVGGPARPAHAKPAGELDPNQVYAYPGAQLECGVTNLGPPIVKIQKNTLFGQGGPFHFVVDNNGITTYGSTDITTTAPNTPQPATPTVIVAWAGDVRVRETSSGFGFTPKDLRCDVTDWQGTPKQLVSDNLPPLSTVVQAANGDTIDCIARNDNAPDVTVTKTVVPADFTGDWSATFAISPVPPGETSPKVATKAAPTVQWFNLQPGVNYTITETNVPPGFGIGPLNCTGVVAPNPDGPSRLPHGDPGTNSFTPYANNHVICGETNYAPPLVYIQKLTLGDVGGPFHIVVNNDNGQKPVTQFAALDITTTQENTWTPEFPAPIVVAPGVVKIAETDLPDHWQLVSLQCDLYDSTDSYQTSFYGPDVLATVHSGEVLKCYAVNEKLSRVTVTKTVRGPAPWSFDMTISPVPPGQPATKTATDVNPTVTWEDLDPGTTYTVSEVGNSNYIVTDDMTCEGYHPIIRGPGRPAHGVVRGPAPDDPLSYDFEVGRNDDVQCAIENTAKAKIVITKSVQNESPNDNWSFTFTVNPGNIKRTATKANPTVTFDGLDPDVDYDITEQGPFDPRFGLGTITCGEISVDAEDGIDEMDIDPGETIACQAVNYRKMTDIAVTKSPDVSTVNLGSTVVWTLTVTNNGPTQADNVVVHDDLPLELDLVSVSAPGGWDCSGSVEGNPGMVHCTKGSMALGEVAVITVTTSVNAGIGSDPIVNSVHVSTSTSETTYVNNDDSAEVEPEELPATGFGSGGLVGVGVALVGAGLLLGGIRRRRLA